MQGRGWQSHRSAVSPRVLSSLMAPLRHGLAASVHRWRVICQSAKEKLRGEGRVETSLCSGPGLGCKTLPSVF